MVPLPIFVTPASLAGYRRQVALLPLSAACPARDAGDMRISDVTRRVAATVREMNEAVRRMTELRMTRDLGYRSGPPSTYAEFLLRTSVTTVHEPSARQRAAASRRASGRTGASRMQPPTQGCCCE